MNQIHFCGGLPRSGSTVLMNILQQNPKLFTTASCALTDIISHHILIKSRYREFFQAMSVEQADKAMYGLIHGATKGWFEALTAKPIVISKNRSWSEVYHLYSSNSKYIVTVRDLRDVVESFERINNKTLALHSFRDNGTVVPAMHIHEKYNYYFNESNSVSHSLNYELPRMMEWFQKDKSKVFFLRYEDLTKEPLIMLKKLCDFLDVEWYNYDLNNIDQSFLFEHDHAYFRERTDHITQSKFRFFETPIRALSSTFHKRIVEENKWFYTSFYPEVFNE